MTVEMASLLRRVEELQNTIADITTELAEIRNCLESKMLEKGAEDEQTAVEY